MKTYKSFLSFTLSLGIIFLTAYLSSFFLEGGREHISLLYSTKSGLPTENIFMLFWGIAYACMVIQMSATIVNRCLRRGIKVWLLLLLTNLLFTLLYFRLSLYYLGAGLIILALILLAILTSFYVRNTRYLWTCSIPLLALYGYSLFLCIVLMLGSS